MRLRLVSDFRDYYDHWFDLDGEPFERLSTGGMSRPEMLAYMDSIGLVTPEHGWIREIHGEVSACGIHSQRTVVYTDERAHRGEGKVLTSRRGAWTDYRDCYVMDFIEGAVPSKCWVEPGHRHSASSLRYLQVGRRKFWLEYWADHGWLSNVGEGGVRVICEEAPGFNPVIREPIWAVDIVTTRYREAYAVDFNIAPGLKGTGIENIIPASEVVELLKEAVAQRVPA